jgi:sigma-E factor negative regulatory protein RseA
MSNAHERDAEQLSALADGELDALDAAQVCTRWGAGAAARATWHAYHLIGDVLRSEDLASAPTRDAAFAARLRTRLSGEPVILTPPPAGASLSETRVSRADRRSRFAWGAASAVAAGFAAVAGVLLVVRGPESAVPAVTLARSEAPASSAAQAVVGQVATQATSRVQASPADIQLVRDSRLDRYLAAHKHFSGSSALGVPSTFLRGATSDASNR